MSRKPPQTKRDFIRFLGNELSKPENSTPLKFGQFLILGQCLGFVAPSVDASEVTSARAAMFDLRDCPDRPWTGFSRKTP